MKQKLDPPSLESMEGHLQTSMEMWVDNINNILCVACLTVFVYCLVKQFAICLGGVAVLLLNVIEVFIVGGGFSVE